MSTQLSGIPAMVHLTLTHMSVAELKDALQHARDCGIVNLLALRGDAVTGEGDVGLTGRSHCL